MLKFMLDTNIAIHVIKRRPIEVMNTFNKYLGQLCLSSITLADLMHEVEKSSKPDQNLMVLESFSSRLEILNYGSKAAAHYGDIRADLEREGKVIGVNDLHIAAHARSEGLILVSNNLKEFERVKGLRTEGWLI